MCKDQLHQEHVRVSPYLELTRTHKLNDRDHAGLADGSAAPEEHLPRYFAKSGHVDMDPKKTKKEGGGKGNWGRDGDEVQDMGYNMTNARRRSNSSTHAHSIADFKTKFETIDPDPVFEEELHGPLAESEEEHIGHEKDASTDSSNSIGSVEEEGEGKKV
ncbi:MAG: hypothetical protein M1834_004589 [Cirrosporium novae-zelandiae]|nr:MAG: hypothetical protein M1834_004589 [Cirrosporium novae-zelandiae]